MKIRQFRGKTAFIVGGSEGIGLSIACGLASLGANVFVFSRSEEKLKKALAEIDKAKGGPSQKSGYRAFDASVESDVRAKLGDAVAAYGVPDLFVNAAGRALPDYFENISAAQFDQTMKTNLYAMWNTLSFILPKMKEKGGHVLNVSSMSGFLGVFGYTDYTASKFAVIGLTEALRSEYKKYDVTFSILCPPDTDTPGYKVENEKKPFETKIVTGTAKCLPPGVVAKVAIAGIQRGKFIILAGMTSKAGYLLKRLFPGLLTSMFDGDVAKAQKMMAEGKTS